MVIYPAIDLLNGNAVRLTKGDFNTAEVFSFDPADVKNSFLKAGATHLHVVDLDGARTGATVNFEVIKRLTSNGTFVQTGGGIRDVNRIEACLDIGISRVILGTAAVKNFDLVIRAVKKYGDKIAVGVDTLNGKIAVEGWEKDSGIDGIDFVKRCADAGVSTVIYTDIATDGAMQGTNLKIFETLSRLNNIGIIASGGITSYEELEALRDMGIGGAILGKALYKGKLDLEKAIKIGQMTNDK